MRLLVFVALALLCTGCDRETKRLTDEEAKRVAWYVEDVAHGVPRDPDELDYGDQSSLAMGELARWAQGTQVDGQLANHPQPLQARRDRWPILVQLCRQGLIAIDNRGFVHFDAENAPPNQDSTPFMRRILTQENAARGETNRLLLILGDVSANSERGAALLTSLAQARRHHAAAEGGRPWQDRSALSSESAATTSTSEPESRPRRAP